MAGIAAGCVVAGIVVIAIIVTICICYQKQRAATGMVIQPVGNNNAGPTVVSKLTLRKLAHAINIDIFSFKNLKFSTEKI